MKRLLALPIGFASRICALCSVLLMLTSAAALAQSADAANPPPTPTQPSVKDEATGGCEPIGLTASGEIVFPFRCKDVVERQRAAAPKPAEPTPAVADAATSAVQAKLPEKPQEKLQAKPQVKPVATAPKAAAVQTAGAVAAKTAASQPAGAAPANAKPAAPPVNAAAHDHAMGPSGCTLFRSYDAASATYLGFDGQRHPCHEVAGQSARNKVTGDKVAGNKVAGNQAAGTQAPHKPSPTDTKH